MSAENPAAASTSKSSGRSLPRSAGRTALTRMTAAMIVGTGIFAALGVATSKPAAGGARL